MAYIGTIVAYLGIDEGIIGMRVLLEKIFFSSNMRVLLEWGDYWNEGTNPEITVPRKVIGMLDVAKLFTVIELNSP